MNKKHDDGQGTAADKYVKTTKETTAKQEFKTTPRNDGTRAVVVAIRVDSNDERECGRGPDCEGFISLPQEEPLQCGLFKAKTWSKIGNIKSHFRCAACLDAELKVDEKKLKEAFHDILRFIQVISPADDNSCWDGLEYLDEFIDDLVAKVKGGGS